MTATHNMDFEKARFLMVEQQIRTWEVLDQGVLDLLFAVKREDFVPVAYRSLAFVDMEIPLDHQQTMMTPKLEARILQEVAPKSDERVLEIGSGSGYLTALLAKQAESVTSIDIFQDFSLAAAAKLALIGVTNVHLKTGDAAESAVSILASHETFDVIVLTGSVPMLPKAYLDMLNLNGRLFAVVGDAPAMKATLFTKTGEPAFTTDDLFETVLMPLVNAKQPSRFEF
jgi:protein-L-isoaspartate(D-aspartate) O-methyltransferase